VPKGRVGEGRILALFLPAFSGLKSLKFRVNLLPAWARRAIVSDRSAMVFSGLRNGVSKPLFWPLVTAIKT
jgi:hypothetical protein